MTLRELAEKKTRSPSAFLIRKGALPPVASRLSSPSTVDDSAPLDPGERLLGTENMIDILPMFPPRGPGPEREWEQASLLPAGSLGMILDSTTRTAWLACSRPGMPPLLIQPFPILGQLRETPLAPVLSPSETSRGARRSEHKPPECPQDIA